MNIPWGNVGIVIVLGIFFIISSWYISRKVKTADQYILGSGKLGVAFGATSLLAFWITGNTVMAAPEAAYTTGVLGAIGYGFLGGIAIVLFAPLAKRIHQVLPDGKTVGDFYLRRFDRKNHSVFLIMVLTYVFGLLMTQGIGGGLLLEQIFGIPYNLAVVLTFIIVISYATMGGFNSVAGVAFFQVVLIVLVVIVVPPVVYLQTGITPVYQGMAQFAPEKLDLLLPAGLLFMFGGTMLGVGEVFMDNTFWQRAYAIRKDKVASIFCISGIGWAFVPVAISTLAFVSLATQKAPAQVNQVAPFVAQIYGGNFVGWLFLICVWSALASTIAAVLNALVALFLNDIYLKYRPNPGEEKLISIARKATVVIGILALLLSLPKLLSMLQMLIFFGVINAAFIFPITYGLFWKKLNVNAAFYAAIFAVATGYYIYFNVGALQGVVASGWVSFFICVLGSWLKPDNFDWKQLQKIRPTN